MYEGSRKQLVQKLHQELLNLDALEAEEMAQTKQKREAVQQLIAAYENVTTEKRDATTPIKRVLSRELESYKSRD
jgi:hypothetical protein